MEKTGISPRHWFMQKNRAKPPILWTINTISYSFSRDTVLDIPIETPYVMSLQQVVHGICMRKSPEEVQASVEK